MSGLANKIAQEYLTKRLNIETAQFRKSIVLGYIIQLNKFDPPPSIFTQLSKMFQKAYFKEPSPDALFV